MMKFGLSDLGAPNMAALGALLAWLARRPTPIAWLVGPPGAGKTATVRAAFGTDAAPPADRLKILALGAASVDRCLQQWLREDPDAPPARASTAQIIARLGTRPGTLLALDALDAVQEQQTAENGQASELVTDLRLRRLLMSLARGAVAEAGAIVTSRLRPPSDLPLNATFCSPWPGRGSFGSLGCGA